jgi:hypothetical protein
MAPGSQLIGVLAVAQNKTVSKSGGKGRASKRSTKKAVSSRPVRPASAATAQPCDDELSIDRRRSTERRGGPQASGEKHVPAPPQLERRKKVNRRRQIDPTTCERDYTDDEVEFMNALDDYKRRSGRMFPTCSEVLEVVRELGYVRLPAAERSSLSAMKAAATQQSMPGEHDALDAQPTSISTETADPENGPLVAAASASEDWAGLE